MRTANQVGPGDFVKTFPERKFEEIKKVELRLNSNSGHVSGTFETWIITTVGGRQLNHFQALSFFKKEDLAKR